MKNCHPPYNEYAMWHDAWWELWRRSHPGQTVCCLLPASVRLLLLNGLLCWPTDSDLHFCTNTLRLCGRKHLRQAVQLLEGMKHSYDTFSPQCLQLSQLHHAALMMKLAKISCFTLCAPTAHLEHCSAASLQRKKRDPEVYPSSVLRVNVMQCIECGSQSHD